MRCRTSACNPGIRAAGTSVNVGRDLIEGQTAERQISPTQSNRIGLRVCSAHIPRSGTAAIRIPSNVTMYGPY